MHVLGSVVILSAADVLALTRRGAGRHAKREGATSSRTLKEGRSKFQDLSAKSETVQAVNDKRLVLVTAETTLKSVIEQKLILNKTRIIITHHYLMRFGPSCDENMGGINLLLLMKFISATKLVPVGYRGGYMVQFEDVMQACNSLP